MAKATSSIGRARLFQVLIIAVIAVVIAILVFLMLSFLGITKPPAVFKELLSRSKPAKEEPPGQIELLTKENESLKGDLAVLVRQLKDSEARVAYLEDQIGELTTELEKAAQREEDIATMVQIYGSMAAGNAANVLSGLPNDDILAILAGLKKDKAAAILSEFEINRASELTHMWIGIKE